MPDLSPTSALSYIIGVILGDGCVYKHEATYKVVLRAKDKIFVESFRHALSEINLNPSPITLVWNEGWALFDVAAYSKAFGVWFKGLTLKDIKEIADKFPTSFIKGFYESEGSVSKCSHIDKRNMKRYTKYCLEFSNSNLELLRLVKSLLAKLKLEMRINGPYRYRRSGYISKYGREPEYHLRTHRKTMIDYFLEMVKPGIRHESEHRGG